jgi:hypothetical protein
VPFQITSIKRLLHATSELGGSTTVVEKQVVRTQERLNRGVDVNEQAFKPFKDPERYHKNSRPLEHAAMLFTDCKYDIERTLSGMDMRFILIGEAAKIAKYQNKMRKFIGWSKLDKDEIMRDLRQELGEAFRQWRG